MEIEYNPAIMKIGKECMRCFEQGYRKPFYRYRAKPNTCVRCRIADNKLYKQRKREGLVNE